MRVVHINTFPYKATGAIMMNVHHQLLAEGIESYVVWGRGREPQDEHEISIQDNFGIKFHGIYTKVTDRTGFASKGATKKLINTLRDLKPNIIHLHNIHGYYINIELLFQYIRQEHIKVFWTLHDCWAFTGHCAYFDMIGCTKWKSGCNHCMQLKSYPASLVMDSSNWNWNKKKEIFTGLDITLICPSYWLGNLVKESFLQDYPVEIIHNGIDTNVFKYLYSDFKVKHQLEEKFIILGVASEWTERKGLKDFIKLSGILGDKYKIVLVGLTKKQIEQLPNKILAFERTANVQELVEIYSKADVFLNPTYEDNFPTTNLEAIACGTPVVTYATGGSPETILDGCGYVIEKGQIEEFAKMLGENEIISMGNNVNIANCDKICMIKQYVHCYKSVRL